MCDFFDTNKIMPGFLARGMLVVVKGPDSCRPGLVVHVNPDKSFDVATVALPSKPDVPDVLVQTCDRSCVHRPYEAYQNGLVDWELCSIADITNSQLITLLVTSVLDLPDCLADIHAVLDTATITAMTTDPDVPTTPDTTLATLSIPDDVRDYVNALPEPDLSGTALVKHVLVSLTGPVPDMHKHAAQHQQMNDLMRCNGDQWLFCQVDPRFADMKAKRHITHTDMDNIVDILHQQQEMMDDDDWWRPSMLELLMIAMHVMCPRGKVALLRYTLQQAPISYAPNVMYNMAGLVDYFASHSIYEFNVVDIGAGCQAAQAGLYAHAKTHTHPMVVNYFGINADSDRYEQFDCHCSVGDVVVSDGDDGATAGVGSESSSVERGTVQVCAASQFAKQAVTLVQQVHKPNMWTVMLVSWAPPDPDTNFLPAWLVGMSRHKFSANLLLMVVGEGLGGCTGDGVPVIDKLLSTAPRLHQHYFDMPSNQVPGTMSHARLFDWSDICVVLKDHV